MAQLTISEAIKRSPIGKSQFYSKYIDGGLITVSVDSAGKKYIDSSEVLRVFGSLSGSPSDTVRKQTAPDSPGLPIPDKTGQSEIIELLKKQLSELKSEANKRELEAIKREEHYRSHIDALTLRLDAPATKQNWFMKFWTAKD